jgi:hypothetical protein
MQGLFQTTNQTGSYSPQNQQGTYVAQSQPSTYVNQQNLNLNSNTSANVNDFSTMQNLFQTQSPGITLTTTTTQETRHVFSNEGKIDPNSSDDIFQSMGINLQKAKQSP